MPVKNSRTVAGRPVLTSLRESGSKAHSLVRRRRKIVLRPLSDGRSGSGLKGLSEVATDGEAMVGNHFLRR